MELWIIATLVAFFIKGLCGFANTLIFTSIMGFGANNINISPVELILGIPTNVILTWKNRKKLKASLVIPLSVLLLIGSIPGAFFLKNVNAQYVKLFFGILVTLIALDMLIREKYQKKSTPNRIILAIVGLISGVLCGMFGIGILLALYINRITESSSEFKANLCAVFIVDNLFRVVLYSVTGIITLDSLRYSGMLMPVMLLALYLGMLCGKHMSETWVKRIVIVLLIISGIALVIKNWPI